jgi:hypothetical protein
MRHFLCRDVAHEHCEIAHFDYVHFPPEQLGFGTACRSTRESALPNRAVASTHQHYQRALQAGEDKAAHFKQSAPFAFEIIIS